MLSDLVAQRAQDKRDDAFCFFQDDVITFGHLDGAVNRLANGLASAGIGADDRVAVMLPSHPEHIYAMLALAKLGATHVPVNVHHKAEGILHLLGHAEICAVIADRRFQSDVRQALSDAPHVDTVIWRGGAPNEAGRARAFDFAKLLATGSSQAPRVSVDPDHLAMVLYTSGTTGPQKGVMITDRMYQAAARNAGIAADARAGDVLFLWEPLHHVAGVQTVILCLQQGIAYGAPAPPELWPRFEQRFGTRIHECYGMTEASSFTTINTFGKVGSIGKPVPEFEVRIVDDNDNPLPPGVVGEIVQREHQPGLIMQGYLNDPEATRAALRGGWLHTGDLSYYDDDGYFYFAGRSKDTVRTRGENVSAWVVERAVSSFPHVEECAVIGVPSDLGEEDIKVFVRAVAGETIDPRQLIRWCEARLAYFQVPRYVTFVESFPKTPSERIRKSELSRATDCWDRAASA